MLKELHSLEFWTTIIIGGMILGCALIFGDIQTQMAVVGTYATVILSLIMAVFLKILSVDALMGRMHEISQKIAHEPNVKEFYDQTIDALCQTFEIKDQVFLELVKSKLNEFRLQLVTELAVGMISFRAESWRVPYQKILSQPDVTLYKSIAWVKSEAYWQDEAGRSSIEFNYELISRGKEIERIFILRDNVLKSSKIKKWIREQRDNGIKVLIAKESSIPSEEDLLYDLGIYGNRAVGYQHIDDNCRTIKFELYFDKSQIERAKEIFERLKLHTLKTSEVKTYLASRA